MRKINKKDCVKYTKYAITFDSTAMIAQQDIEKYTNMEYNKITELIMMFLK